MIRYSLVCKRKHDFESWFPNSAAYDKQVKRGLVTCPVCGSAKVEKAIMAPRLTRAEPRIDRGGTAGFRGDDTGAGRGYRAGRYDVAAGARAPQQAQGAARPPDQECRQRRPRAFPEEARKMHYGEIEHRSIYGEASPEEAKIAA